MANAINLTWAAPDNAYFGILQSAAGAATLTLKDVDPRVEGFQRTVSLTSAFNNSGVNFTITGYDIYGALTSEVLAGPNANTVESVNEYHRLTSVTVAGAITATSIGTGTGGTSILVLNTNNTNFQTSLDFGITGTVDYSVTRTSFDPQSSSAVYFAIVAALTNASANQTYALTQPSSAVKVIMAKNAANTGTVAINLLQQGTW